MTDTIDAYFVNTPYRLAGFLGRGGMGEVYRPSQPSPPGYVGQIACCALAWGGHAFNLATYPATADDQSGCVDNDVLAFCGLLGCCTRQRTDLRQASIETKFKSDCLVAIVLSLQLAHTGIDRRRAATVGVVRTESGVQLVAASHRRCCVCKVRCVAVSWK